MDANLRPSGIDGLGDIAWGTHFCLFYETKEDLLDFFIPFLKSGLEHQEFCLFVASEPLIAEEAERAMQQTIPDFGRYVAEGQLEITPRTDWYLKDGRFDEQPVLRGWIDKLDKALAKGFSGLRFAANFLLDRPDWESFVRFEAKLEDRLHDLRIEGLCAYDLNRYSAATMLDVIRHHQFTLVRRDGSWEPLEGAQLKRAHEEVLKLNNELEQRVAERTTELAAANAQLRREITERKQVERSLQETNSKLQLILNNSPLPIVGEDANARVTAWNQAAERLFGWTEQEVLGQRCPAVPSEETDEYLKMVRQVMQGETYLGLVRYRQKKGGSLLNCSISVAPQRNERGEPIGVTFIIDDITERKRAEDAARESEKLLRLVLDTLPVGVAVTDPADNIIVANPASKRIWGDVIISGTERRERSIAFWHDSGKRIVPEEWASLRALSKGETSLNELIDIETFDGVHKIIRNSSAPIRNSEGIIVGAVFVNEDVTERKRAEEETKHQAARAETLARIAARLNKQLDLEAVIHAVCQEAVDTFKVSQAIISLYDKKRDLLDYAGGVNIPRQYGAKIESVSRAQFEESVRTMGPILVVPDVQARPKVPSPEFTFDLNVRTVVSADMRRDQELIGVLVLGVNGQVREFDPDELSLLKAISDQAAIAIANALLLKRANEQHEQLRALSTRLVQVQETERRALTTELHDRVGQNLTGLSILLQNIKALLSDEIAKSLGAEFDDAQVLVQDTTRHIRDIMAELYLPELEDHGLAAALETYADRVASRANLDLVVDLPEPPLRLSSDVRVALFRAAQEAISNVLKHADATQLEISLQRENGRVRLRVEDNGRGFEPSPESPNETLSWGLRIMRERIESIGGKVWIESKPGEGTRVTFEIERFS
jgi:PAS domain S-box-containing protein